MFMIIITSAIITIIMIVIIIVIPPGAQHRLAAGAHDPAQRGLRHESSERANSVS